MSEICGENYEIQCGEVFLHLMSGKLTFHCTLCESKYDSYQNYADHVATEHSPSVEWEEDEVVVDELDAVPADIKEYGPNEMQLNEDSRIIVKDEVPIKEEDETFMFDESSYNSFADEYEQELNELEVGPEQLKEEIFVETKSSASLQPQGKKKGRKQKPEPVSIPTEDARPVKIKYINKNDERKFRCPNCDFSCKLKRNLKGHLRRHAKERPFPCTFCERGFYTTTELKVHLRTHTGERPFLCMECGDSFITCAKLNEHRRVHDPTPTRFQCEECGKVFFTSSSLRAHAANHKSEKYHKCTKCKASFDHLIDLKNHFQLHEKKKVYECVICDARFNERAQLNSHLQSKHMSIYL